MVIVRAPVRISFGGGGTDLAAYYSRYGGFVVSAAITRYCSVMAYAPAEGGIQITSADFNRCVRTPARVIPRVDEPLSLPKAAIARFAAHGLRDQGIDLFLASEVPPGTGLGSSSAMAVGLVHALAAYLGLSYSVGEVAEIASAIEIEYLGMPIGKQDQYASAFGGLNTIEFTVEGITVSPLPLPPGVRTALANRLMLFSTGRSRHSSEILKKQRDDTGTDRAVTDSLHRIKELAWEMRDALLAHDLDGFGRLLDRGWQEKKRLSSRISSGAIDEWYTAARDAGALGGKITGAGGGGFLLLYCPPRQQPQVRQAMMRAGLQEMTFGFDMHGAQILTGRSESATVTPLLAGRLQQLPDVVNDIVRAGMVGQHRREEGVDASAD